MRHVNIGLGGGTCTSGYAANKDVKLYLKWLKMEYERSGLQRVLKLPNHIGYIKADQQWGLINAASITL